MNPSCHLYPLLKKSEIERFLRSALHILSEMGMEVCHRGLLERLANANLQVDFSNQRVRFPTLWVESWMAGATKFDWENACPTVSASSGIYYSKVHDPQSGELVSWTENYLANYIALAKSLPNVGSAVLLGSRLTEFQANEPLYERYYAWKWGAIEGGSILLEELCQPLYEIYEVAAQYKDIPIEKLFQATVYLIPALKLGRHEAWQINFFLERGLKVHIGGSMLTMGANAPVTLAGSVTLNLAEQLALRILDYILFDHNHLFIGASIAPLDMRTIIRPFGRPEMIIANLMTAQIARYIGAAFSGHAGLTDAKLPSTEAGAQKALSALPTLLAGGNLWMDAGLLAIDEVCSPIQMVLDNEFLSVLKHFTHDYEVDDDAIGLEMILQAGPGGNYVAEHHTAQRFRGELWQPTIWSREMLAPWVARGARLDVDKAREIALSIQPGSPEISSEFEKDILHVIAKFSG